MTTWGRPPQQGPGHGMAGAPPAPPAPTSPLAAYRRARRVPLSLFRVSITLLLIAAVAFIVSLEMAPTTTSREPVPEDGSTRTVTLQADTQYGFYSEDQNPTCEVVDPSGTTLTLSKTSRESVLRADPGPQPGQVLDFRSTQAGAYSISCSGAHPITFSTAAVSPEWRRAFTIAQWAVATAAIAGLVTLLSGVRLLVLRSRRLRSARTALGVGPAPGAPRPVDTPGPAGFTPAAGPVPPGSPTSAAWSGSSATSGPGAAVQAGSPEPPLPSSGAYGLAPQQVIYRPMPPQKHDGS